MKNRAWLVVLMLVLGSARRGRRQGREGRRPHQRIRDCDQRNPRRAGWDSKDLLNKAECGGDLSVGQKGGVWRRRQLRAGTDHVPHGAVFFGVVERTGDVALEAGSFGFQIGAAATDFVLLVMNESGANSVMSSKVKLGADAAVAAGPVGRDAAAATDIVLKAEILSYSRSKGLFAGVVAGGFDAALRRRSQQSPVRKELSAKEIVRLGKVPPPASAQRLLAILRRASPKQREQVAQPA